MARLQDVILGGVIFASLTPFHRLVHRVSYGRMASSLDVVGATTLITSPDTKSVLGDVERSVNFYRYMLGNGF
jgi:hypothetical protein